MIGFSLKISELKELPSAELLAEIKGLRETEAGERLRRALEGRVILEGTGPTVLPAAKLGKLLRSVGPRRNGEQVLLELGYPILLIAKGDMVLLNLADPRSKLHSELLRSLDHGEFYLVECWDLS